LFNILGLKKFASQWFYFHSRVLSGFIFKLVGLKLHVSMSESAQKIMKDKKAVCFFSNHTSMLDIPAVVFVSKVQTGFVAKAVVRKIPAINLLAKAMKCVFIDRSNRQDSINGIRNGVKILESGHSMLVFPEGTRSKTGAIAPFKPGSFRLAMESHTPIIPVTIKGLRQSMEGRKKFFGSFDAYIDFGNPVYISIDEDRDVRFEKITNFESNIRETYASLGDNNV